MTLVGDSVIFLWIISGNEEAFDLPKYVSFEGVKIITRKQAGEIHASGHPYRH